MLEKDSKKEHTQDALNFARELNIEAKLIDITPYLEELGIYKLFPLDKFLSLEKLKGALVRKAYNSYERKTGRPWVQVANTTLNFGIIYQKKEVVYGSLLSQLSINEREAIRFALGKKFTVIIKLNSEDFTEGGFTQSEMLQVAAMLEQAGIDAIELSGSISLKISEYASVREGRIDSKEEEVYYRDAAKLYKREIAVPLILVGGIRSYEVAKELIEKEQADYISLCRPLIREPGLIKRWQSGDTEKATCISCNKCFVPTRAGKGMYCIFEKVK